MCIRDSLGTGLLAKTLAHEAAEGGKVAFWLHAQKCRRQRRLPRRHRIGQHLETLLRWHIAVLVPVGAQEADAFALGKTVEEILPGRLVARTQRACGRIDRLIGCLLYTSRCV